MGDSQSPVWSNYTVTVRARMDGPAPHPPGPPGPSPSPPPASTGTTIVQASSKSPAYGQCLNVVGQSTADGTGIMAYQCGELASKSSSSSIAADRVGASARGASHADKPNEDWVIGGGTLKCFDKCATVMPNGDVELYTCNGDATQQWSAEWPTIKHGSGSCLGLGAPETGYPANKRAVAVPCSSSDATQEWTNGTKPGIDVMPAPQFVRVCGRISKFTPDGTPPQGCVSHPSHRFQRVDLLRALMVFTHVRTCLLVCLFIGTKNERARAHTVRSDTYTLMPVCALPRAAHTCRYCLIVDINNSWYLAAGGAKGPDGRDAPHVIANGTVPTLRSALLNGSVDTAASEWITLTLDLVRLCAARWTSCMCTCVRTCVCVCM
jgi:hypothetical protein